MSAAIDYLSQRGRTAKAKGKRIAISPASRLTPDVCLYIEAHRTTLLIELAANDALSPSQIDWLAGVASLLEVEASYLIKHRFIEPGDLLEQLHVDPHQVAALILTDPRWGARP